ncbi:uncharacterized protein Dwil_GK11258 [Drosophila willistoni]|uniref:MADF domain-containing protein n=1 Tax=Drosophila willistoni TaxID=7260 RepID=B4NB30_DROWI|nr:dynein axonemal assembly factor 1 homolog [Drosophila willistoni]EDW80994.2 uncharacterized protein Dwil_GK11258 [Drosophila willistoni]
MGNHKVLRTAGTAARYSMYEFIDAIRSQRIIWDRRHPNFHNRALRDKSWQQIGQELCNNFDLASATERQEIVKTLLKRWKNTRDSYLRINRLRQSGEDVGRASYIYEKELRFLLDAKAETEEDEETSPKKTTALVKRKRGKSLILKAINKRKSHAQNSESITDYKNEIIEADSQHSEIDEFCSSSTEDAEEGADVIVDPCSSSIIEFALESDTDVNTSPTKPTFATSKTPDSYIYEKELRFLLDAKAATQEDKETSPNTKTTSLAKRKRAKSIILQASNKRKSQTQNTESMESISDHQKAIIETDRHSVIDEFSTSTEVVDEIVDPCSGSIIEFALESDNDANSSFSEPTLDASTNPDPDQAFFDSIKPHMQLMSNARKLDFQIEVLQLLRNFNPN